MKIIFKKITKLVGIMLAMALTVSLVGCGVDITSIGLPTDVVMEKGETQQLNIEYGAKDEATKEKIAEAASKLKLEWASSNEEVVTVDETGLVTAVSAGEADVTVSVADANISSSTHIKVVISPTGVEAPDTLELVTNGENSKSLDAKLIPEDATEVKLAYKSSDENVATVDANGTVTAVADGECVITTYVTADISATAETAVTEEKAVTVGDVASETAEAESGINSDVVVVLPDDLANVDSAFGVVPDGLSAETKVTVTTKVESIILDKTEGILNVGGSVTINATVTPDNATNASVNWSSSDESVATVDSSGKVTAVSVGNATITAVSESDGDVSADYALTVQQKTASKNTTKNSAGNSYTSSGSAATGSSQVSAPSYSAPTETVTPSAPAEAPAPDPAPAPAEPSQPSNDNNGSSPDYSGSSGFDSSLGSWSEGSGIDWVHDNTSGGENEEIIIP